MERGPLLVGVLGTLLVSLCGKLFRKKSFSQKVERKREERGRGQNQKSKGTTGKQRQAPLPLDFDWKAALFLSESQASMSTEEVCNETTEVVVELAETAERKTGQKFQTPSPGYADRVFYESLLEQRPDSEMAQEWCVQYGILPEERAAELWKLICKLLSKII